MGQLPEGELMSRAARGLAEVCRARCADVGGTAVVALVALIVINAIVLADRMGND